MKKSLTCIFTAILLGFLPCRHEADAVVANTEHDMTLIAGSFGGTWGGQGVCSYCHVPHAAAGARLWAAPPAASVPVYGTSVVASLCYTCHDGTALTAANHNASVYNTAKMNHVLIDSGTITDTDQQLTGWPWTTAGAEMECSSCHNPHDNAFNQFLRDTPYSDTPTAAVTANDPTADTAEFCNNCHQRRAKQPSRNGTFGVLDGNHPVGSQVIDGRRFGTTGTVDMNKAPYNTEIDNTIVGPGTLGGHLSSYTTGGVVCNTCHMPHGAADNRVLVLTNSAAGTGYNTLCQDCHSTDPSLRVNVPRSVHPVNDMGPGGTGDGNTSNGPITIIDWNFSNNLRGARQGTLGFGEVVCLSCHTPHQADGLTAILREQLQVPGDGSICSDCHTRAPVGGSNHPNGDFPDADITNEDGGTWPNRDGLPLFGASGTRVYCDTCHAAHDGEPVAEYLLRIRNNYSEICNGCHTQLDNTATDFMGTVAPPPVAGAGGDSANPSAYIYNEGYAGNQGASLLAHQGTHAAYRTISKPAYEVVLTAASGRSGNYGPVGGVIICESCHLAHGGSAAGGWHGSVGSNDLIIFENGVSPNRTGLDGGTDGFSPGDDSYCSPCHAGTTNPVAPDGTHPVQSWTVTRTGSPVNTGVGSFANVQPPTATADYAAGVMTCESCHSPHAAETSMGSFILEGGTSDAATGGTRPVSRDRDGLCLKCHTY